MKTVAVTGAGGFVGSAVVAACLRRGWRIVALTRSAPRAEMGGVTWRRYRLEDPVPASLLHDADALVHAAYVDARDGAAGINVDAGRRLADAAEAANLQRRVFVSSLAAGARATSGYAQQKVALERVFSSAADAVVRPGLVLGNGGLFARMRDHLRRSSFVPLIGTGRQPLQTVYVDDVAEAIARVLDRNLPGTFTIAQPQAVTYERFYRDLAAALGVDVRFLRIPFWAAYGAASAAELLRVRLPVGRDNLLGLAAMTVQDSAGDLATLELHLRSYEQSIALAVKGD